MGKNSGLKFGNTRRHRLLKMVSNNQSLLEKLDGKLSLPPTGLNHTEVDRLTFKVEWNCLCRLTVSVVFLQFQATPREKELYGGASGQPIRTVHPCGKGWILDVVSASRQKQDAAGESHQTLCSSFGQRFWHNTSLYLHP